MLTSWNTASVGAIEVRGAPPANRNWKAQIWPGLRLKLPSSSGSGPPVKAPHRSERPSVSRRTRLLARHIVSTCQSEPPPSDASQSPNRLSASSCRRSSRRSDAGCSFNPDHNDMARPRASGRLATLVRSISTSVATRLFLVGRTAPSTAPAPICPIDGTNPRLREP